MASGLLSGGAGLMAIWGSGLLVKSAVLLAVVLTLIWFRRRASAAARHQVLASVALSVLLLPILSFLVPSWDLGWFHLAQGTAVDAGNAEPEAGRSSWLPSTLALVWLGGSLILLTLLAVGRLRGLAAARSARALQDERLAGLVDDMAGQLGLQRPIEVLVSDRIKVPVVFGWWSPRLMVPETMLESSEHGLDAIMMHELAHIKRNDVLTQSLAQLMCCLHWPNPLAWMVERRLMIERERACDDIVLLSGGRASDYARILMDTAGALRAERNPVWAMAAMAEGTDFKDRVLSILDPNARRERPPAVSAVMSAVMILLVAVLVAAAQPFAASGMQPTAGALLMSDEAMADQRRSRLQSGQQPGTTESDHQELIGATAVSQPSANNEVAEAVASMFDAIGAAVSASARKDEEAMAEAELVQQMLGSLGGVVRNADDEQVAKEQLAELFRSLAALVVINPPAEQDEARPAQQQPEQIAAEEGCAS